MIKVNLKYNNDLIESISITGHAGFDVYGKDIVCASVSSIVITSVNAIVRLSNDSINYDDSNGLSINVLNHNDVTDTLIDNMVSLFEMVNSNNEKKIFYLKFDLTNFIGNFFKKHEELIYLTRRGKSNLYILTEMKEMILSDKLKVKKILWLINQFTELIKKNEEFAKTIISNTKSNEKLGKDFMEIDLIYYLKSKKNNITQDKFLVYVFQGILNDEVLTNDNQCIKIMNYLLYFYYILKDKKEDNIISIFSDIFHGFYEEIEDKSNLISLFLNFKYLPKEKDLGLFLIKEKKNSFLQQLGINILLSKCFFN